MSTATLHDTFQGSWEQWNPIPPHWRGPAAFSARCWLASMLALLVSYYLQLDEPYWAGMAVWMVAQPTPGMATSKSIYRIAGTMVGSAMGVVLLGLFPQAPELFIAALALWIGLTTIASNLLRNFRSYGAVLAGYTAAIIGLEAYNHPDQVFLIAMSRASATIIGIACSALVTSMLSRHETEKKTVARLRDVIGLAARRGAFPPDAPLREKMKLGVPLTTELIALDAEIGFASAESAEFRIHADTARSLLAHLFGVYATKRSLDARLVRTGAQLHPVISRLLEKSTRLLATGEREMREGRAGEWAKEIALLRAEVASVWPEESEPDVERAVSQRVVLDRLDDLLGHFSGALHDWSGMRGGWVPTVRLELNFHRDHRAALINGLRAFLAVGAAGAFWIASAWSTGPYLVIETGVVCSLFSAAPRPDRQGASFLWGACLAVPAAFLTNFFLLEHVTGFPLFALAMAWFILPMAMLFLNPKTTAFSLAACVNFFAISAPTNPMNYDVVAFLNNAVATVAGVAFGVLAYKLFLPPNPRAARRYVVQRIGRGLELLAQHEPVPPACSWQSRMADRVNRLHDPANLSGTPTDEWFDGGLEAMNLGSELLLLRRTLHDKIVTPPLAELGRSVVKVFARVKHDPAKVEQTLRKALERFPEEPSDRDGRRCWLRLRGIFEEMKAFFEGHPDFFEGVPDIE